MRAAAILVLGTMLGTAPALGTSCVTIPIDVRRAEVVAVARYAGARTFVVESVLRTIADRPGSLVAPEDWLTSPCAPREPVPGQAYLVARFESGSLGFVDHARSADERALIERLHPVTAPEILDALERYSRDEATADELNDWLRSAMVDWSQEGSFTVEFLDLAESFVGRIWLAEACHPDAYRAFRADDLPEALRTTEKILPDVDAETDFVAARLAGVTDPELRGSRENEALEEWEGTLDALRGAMQPLERSLQALPWCETRKDGS